MSYDMIRRDALLEFARNHIDGKIDCNDIARFPYANAEPVRHGRWIAHCDSWLCSECDAENAYAYHELTQRFTDKYCPNCGAKMDGDEREDTSIT